MPAWGRRWEPAPPSAVPLGTAGHRHGVPRMQGAQTSLPGDGRAGQQPQGCVRREGGRKRPFPALPTLSACAARSQPL